MPNRGDLLSSIANMIIDYRAGQIPEPTPSHVDKWVRQFPVEVQVPLLSEMDFVLGKTYITSENFHDGLKKILFTDALTGGEHGQYWRRINFLNNQQGGNSQADMLSTFDKLLQNYFGYSVSECGGSSNEFIYLDDGIFSGNRVKQDIQLWIDREAPSEAKLHVLVLISHSGGEYYADECIKKHAKNAGKSISTHFWSYEHFEDRKMYSSNADVLRPVELTDDPLVSNYLEQMEYEPALRNPGNVGKCGFYSSDEGKQLLEHEFLMAGLKIRKQSPLLKAAHRPLGYTKLDTLGFGAIAVFHRNCPNNAPLALWAGDPWYPLFPRVTNRDASVVNFIDMFKKGGAQ